MKRFSLCCFLITLLQLCLTNNDSGIQSNKTVKFGLASSFYWWCLCLFFIELVPKTLHFFVHHWTLFRIIYFNVLLLVERHTIVGKRLIGRQVRVQHEWNGPLVSSMERERFFVLLFFPCWVPGGPPVARPQPSVRCRIPLLFSCALGSRHAQSSRVSQDVGNGITWKRAIHFINTRSKGLSLCYKQTCMNPTSSSMVKHV